MNAAAAAALPSVAGIPIDFILFACTLAGVSLSNVFPEARAVGKWLRHGWHVAVGSVLGFAILPLVWGWHPEPLRKAAPVAPAPAGVQK